jgi:multicomponent Na+:H+ antiporter subunit D
VLGASMFGPFATIGGLAHLVHQGLMKITMFFAAGALAERLRVHDVDQLDGVGWVMPWTVGAFSVAALAMIGLPPMAGFISKWYLGVGAFQGGQAWVVLVLVGSSLLNAMYFLPLLYRAWFVPRVGTTAPGLERPLGLVAPAVVSASLVLLVGLLAATPYSPLAWAALIVERTYAL